MRSVVGGRTEKGGLVLFVHVWSLPISSHFGRQFKWEVTFPISVPRGCCWRGGGREKDVAQDVFQLLFLFSFLAEEGKIKGSIVFCPFPIFHQSLACAVAARGAERGGTGVLIWSSTCLVFSVALDKRGLALPVLWWRKRKLGLRYVDELQYSFLPHYFFTFWPWVKAKRKGHV